MKNESVASTRIRQRGRLPKKPAQVTLPTITILDATPERLNQATQSGLATVHAEILDASGFGTGGRRREVLGVIESLHARKIVTDIQYQAGARFITLWATAARGPRITQRWDDTPRGNGDTDSERIERASRAYVASWRAVPIRYRPALNWLIDTQTAENTPTLIELGLKYQGSSGKESARSRGKIIIHFALDDLGKHYGF